MIIFDWIVIQIRRFMTMLEKLSIQDFDKVYKLMEMAFPGDEYRTYDEQKALLNHPNYTVYVLYDEFYDIKSFIAVWEFNEFAFIEHFAVNPKYRNQGLGTWILNQLATHINKPLCLEVEPPETELARRRIEFYKRNNFFFNAYPYIQPAMSEGKNPVPLFIMTSGSKVQKGTFESIKNTLYTHVYQQM